MTLDKIKVKDFQSIHSGEVELGSFTVFTGPSSSGKSAFLRAAQAVVRNSFTPAQVRMGAKETIVSVEFDGHKVEAHRGKSKSTYILDGEEYTKAGRNVPEPVADAFRMKEIAEIESSFSTQFDKPYLIADPGSVAAKALGTLTNVSVLHGGLREANRRGLEVKSRLKVKGEDLSSADTKLLEYEDLDRRLELLRLAEEAHQALLSKEEERKALDAQILNLNHLTEALKAARGKIIPVGDLPSEAEELDSKAETLKTLSAQTAKIQSLASQLKRVLSNLKPSPEYDTSMDTRLEEAKELTATLARVSALVKSYKAAASKVTAAATQIREKQAESDTLFSGLETCPLCSAPPDRRTS